jgi:hypothetical protein
VRERHREIRWILFEKGNIETASASIDHIAYLLQSYVVQNFTTLIVMHAEIRRMFHGR